MLPIHGEQNELCGSAFTLSAQQLILEKDNNRPTYEIREEVFRQGLEQYALELIRQEGIQIGTI